MPDEEERRFAKASFASWKFDLIKGLLLDPNVRHSDFRVAVAVVSHLSAKTMDCYPSQDVLARECHMTARSVRLSLDHLRDIGWIGWKRGNRQLANIYSFQVDKIAEARARVGTMATRRDRSERKPASGRDAVLRGTQFPVATGSQLPPNTLSNPASKSRRAAK